MIYMLWKECMPTKFYKHICQEKNFVYLNCKKFIEADDNNYRLLQNNLSSYKTIFQYVYSNVFPEIYCSTEKRGFDLKSNFHIMFKTYKDKKQLQSSMGKNPANYETIRKETNIYEQKPVNIDDFNEAEKVELKQGVEKRKGKRRIVAEKNKLVKNKRKTEENRVNENDMWECLAKLNSEFKYIKKAKKDSKKMSETIIN